MEEHPDPKARWKNRRRMAWFAFVGAMLFPLLAVYGLDIKDLAWPFYTFAGAVVGAYIGFSTADDKWQKP